MDLFKWLFRRKATIEDVIRYYDSRNSTVAGVTINESSALAIATVYACARIVSETIGQTPLLLYKRDEDGFLDEDFSHPVHSLLAVSPNDNETVVGFLENLVHNQLFCGKAFTYVTYNSERRKKVLELVPISPNRIRIDRDLITGEPLRFVMLNPGGGETELDKSRLIFHKAYKEMSLLQSARNSMGIIARAEQHEGNVLAKGAALRGILKIMGRHSPSELVRRGQDFDKATSGDNSGSTIALAVDEDYKPITMTNSDLQLIQTKAMSQADVCAAFRVPLYMITGQNAPSNMEVESRRFYVQALGPIFRRIELDFTNHFMKSGAMAENKFQIKFNINPYLLGDNKTQAYVQDTMIKNGSMCPDEVRKTFNMRPRPDGKGKDFVDITEVNTGLVTTSGTQVEGTPPTGTDDNPSNEGTLNGNQ